MPPRGGRLALMFAVVSRRIPAEGGRYAYARAAFGNGSGFSRAWLYWITPRAGNAAIVVGWVFYGEKFVNKVMLGGASSSMDLQKLSVLLGERDEHTDSVTVGDYAPRSIQRSTRRMAIMPPERVRTLPFGIGRVLLRSAPPIVATLRRCTER